MSEDTIFFGVLIAVIIGVCAWVFIRMPRGNVAEIVVQPGVPFEVRCTPNDGKTHRVCLDFSLTVAGRDPNMFGLACALSGEIGGNRVLNEVVGVGYRAAAVRPITMDAKTRFKQTTTRLAAGCKVAEKVVLTDLGPRVNFSEMAVRGTITTTDNVTVHSMRVGLSR